MPAAEYPPVPASGRVTRVARHVGLADVAPDGRARLDALARFLQDVSDHDATDGRVDGEVDGAGVWVLRRLAMRIARVPRFRADLELATWCSGVGPRWAERRSDVHAGGDRCVEAVALWAHVDPAKGSPLPLPSGFHDRWGETVGGRRVSARLRHAPPPDDARGSAWSLRATDLDVLGHVNNAAYWAPVEEELTRRGRPRVAWAEIEFRAGIDATDDVAVVVADRERGFALWLLAGGAVRASVLVGCAR